MNDKTQPSKRQDGFGTEGIGEDGDGSIGTAGSSGGGTGSTGDAGGQRGGHKVEGAFGQEGGSHGRRNPANKQGLPGQQESAPSPENDRYADEDHGARQSHQHHRDGRGFWTRVEADALPQFPRQGLHGKVAEEDRSDGLIE